MSLEDLTRSLHTNRLEAFFGKVHCRVLTHTDLVRVVEIVNDANDITTLAFTLLKSEKTKKFPIVKEEIAKGGLIGETIKKHGLSLRKQFISRRNVVIGSKCVHYFKSASNETILNVYELYIDDEGDEELYGIVNELVNPNLNQNIVGSSIAINTFSNFLEAVRSELKVDYLPEFSFDGNYLF